jgi:hypothetical protein
MKRTFIIRGFIVIALLVISYSSYSQEDWKTELKKELVKVDESNFTVKEFSIIKLDAETNLQLKTSAKAPVSVISRDNFVSIYSTFGVIFLYTMLSEAGYDIATVDMKELDELIGEADISIHFEMTKNGMQIQISSGGEKMNQTMTWEEIFKK